MSRIVEVAGRRTSRCWNRSRAWVFDQHRVRCYVPPKVPKMTKQFEAGRQARQHILQELDGVGRFLGVLFVLVVALLTAAPVPASSPSDDHAEQALETLLNQTNLHPRAFVKDHKIRIYYTNDA